MASNDVISPVDSAPASRLTKRQVIVVGLIIGFSLALTLCGVVVIALRVNNIQQADIHRNQRAIRRLDRVTNDLKKLTKPTKAQYRQQLEQGFKRCAAEPKCKEVLIKLVTPTKEQ